MLVLGSPSMVMLLLYLFDFACSFPSHFVKPSVPLNEFIKHYEPAFYDVEEVTNQHRRIKRKAGIYEKINTPLKLTISTSNRVFKLSLRPDHSLFADDVEFEGAKGRKIEFDPGTVYVGTLEDDERTKVRGIITKNGLFDGTITTQFEEFYVEPVSRYSQDADHVDNTHSIVYKTTDVVHPTTSLCAISHSETRTKPTDLNTIAHRSKRKRRQANNDRTENSSNIELDPDEDRGWPKFRNLFPKPHHQKSHPDKRERSPVSGLLSTHMSVRPERDSIEFANPSSSDGSFYDLDFVNLSSELNLGGKKSNYDDDNNKRYEFNDDHLNPFKPSNNTLQEMNNKHWRPSSGIIDTVYKYTNVTKGSKGYLPPPRIIHKSNPKILIGNGADESHANLIITGDDSLEQHARKRVIVDAKKTTCMLYLQADHLFFEKYGTEETCIEVMTRHVQRVNSIYRNTDFNQDGKPDNISFMIKRIKVHSVKDPSYRFPGNYGVEKFLEIFSEEDYDSFCLAYMFTYRDFEMGTLGLAWTGDLKNAGGVCEKNGHYRGSLKSLNTGIVTVLNYGKHVPSAVSHVTLAHEIGHNFGSPHDPDGCTPGGDDGNFIMFARATSGDKKNNNKFSPCSLHAINPVLNAKARSAKGCFTEPQTSICGNGVVEPGEECDCGWEEDCRDSCCYPQRKYPPLDETPCRLTSHAVCSPSQGPCCSTTCQLKFGDMCRNDNGCRDSSYCNGSSSQCPPSINKPNKTICNDEFVCYMGECTGSICLAYGLESCQCVPTSDNPTKACELCCKLPGENQPCISSFQWNQTPYDVPDMYSKPGTPCREYNGYCDVFRKCREVDPSGPIATLRKLLLSEENIATFKKWAQEHWYYCVLTFFSFLSLMVFSTKILGKKPKVKSVTVVHSSATEPVRLPTDGSGGPAVVVHPIVVRSKLPFRKKVHENKRRTKSSPKKETVPHNVNNNNSPVEAKKKTKKRVDVKTNAKAGKGKESKSPKKELAVTATKVNENISDDPLGKVRNWLISSHNIDSFSTLKKSKSSPPDVDLSDPAGAKKRGQRTTATTNADAATKSNPSNVPAVTTTAAATKVDPKKSKKPKDGRVKLQVVYKPPFKFSVKLGKNKNEISSHLIRDKRPEAVKQRAALFVRADRIRANVAANATSPTTNAKIAKPKTDKAKTNAVEVDKKEASRNTRAKYKRSVSAPQSEPVYQNTLIDLAGNACEEKRIVEEPHYANLPADENNTMNSFDWKNAFPETEAEKSRTRAPQQSASNAIKRRNSSDVRPSAIKQHVSGSVSKVPSARRRNSCDAGVSNNKAVEMVVKRQHSDETEVKTTNAKSYEPAELKRSHLQLSRLNHHKSNVTNSSKPVRLKCSYDVETSNLMTPCITSVKSTSSSKRKDSTHEGNNQLPNAKSKERRPNVRRSMSNNTPKDDKFKRYSLQQADLLRLSHAEGDKHNVPTTTSRESTEGPFRQVDLTSEIPSDTEVLLYEVGNAA